MTLAFFCLPQQRHDDDHDDATATSSRSLSSLWVHHSLQHLHIIIRQKAKREEKTKQKQNQQPKQTQSVASKAAAGNHLKEHDTCPH